MTTTILKTLWQFMAWFSPHIWTGLKYFWLFVALPLLTLAVNILCATLGGSDDEDDTASYGSHYNLLSGEHDITKRPDGRYFDGPS